MFSEVKNDLEMANGQLQYHLGKNRFFVKKEKGYVTEKDCISCEPGTLCEGRCIIGFLSNEKKARILKMLEGIHKKEIIQELEIDPSTLSYHLINLRENNLLYDGIVRPEIKKSV